MFENVYAGSSLFGARLHWRAGWVFLMLRNSPPNTENRPINHRSHTSLTQFVLCLSAMVSSSCFLRQRRDLVRRFGFVAYFFRVSFGCRYEATLSGHRERPPLTSVTTRRALRHGVTRHRGVLSASGAVRICSQDPHWEPIDDLKTSTHP